MSCWINTISEQDASGTLKDIYQEIARTDGTVHNLYKAFSLWPEPLPHADKLYSTLLHTGGASLEGWCLELVATYVAVLAECEYAQTHHSANFAYLLGDAAQAESMLGALRDDRLDDPIFDAPRAAMLRYTRKLTLAPQTMTRSDIEDLHAAGVDDRAILEVNQVCANFNYWVRVINGLGIALGDEKIGKY